MNQGGFTWGMGTDQDYLDIDWLLVHLAGHHSGGGSGRLRVIVTPVTKGGAR